MKPNFQSIKLRLILLGVALCLLGVLVRQFIALPRFQEHVVELVASQQLSLAAYVAHDVDSSMTARMALIARFAGDMPRELLGHPQRMDAWLQDRQRANPLFNGGLLLLQPGGHALADAPELQAAISADAPAMSSPLRLHGKGDAAIVFTAPLRDAAGNVVAHLGGVALISKPGFLDSMQEQRVDGATGFLLVSPFDKVFVAANERAMVLAPTPPAGVNPLHDRAMKGFRGTGVTTNAQGVEELSAIASVPSTGWFVVARLPAAQALRPVYQMRDFMFKASAGLAAFVLAVLMLSLSRILRPLVEAARAIRDMAASKSALVPLPVVRDDEVGHLVSGFNFLVARLRKEEAARRASDEQLVYMAHHDSLTGLYNRAMLESRLGQELARSARVGSQVALLFCDLDGFKSVNDQHGHQAGDAVLRQVAVRLSNERRRVDTVARLGGDEFVIVLSDLKDAHTTAISAAKQCLAAMQVPFEYNGKKLSLGMSIGIAVHAGSAVAPSHLLAQADIAMYQAKRRGKGNCFFIEETRMALS